MDYRKLRYFSVVAREGSLHKATERLHLSQPALTRAIQDLEADVDAKLFTRHARGVTLTDEGSVLLEHAEGLLAQAEKAKEAVMSVGRNPRGVVSIGIPPSLSVALMVPLTTQVASSLPLVQLNMHERMMPDLLEMLSTQRLDAAIVGNPPTSTSFGLRFLFSEEVFLIGPADTGLSGDIPITVLEEYPLIFPGSGIGAFSWVEEKTRSCGLSLTAKLRVESPSLAMALVASGQGFALLPRSALQIPVPHDAFSMATVEGLRLDRYLATNSERILNRAATAVLGLIDCEASKLSRERGYARMVSVQ